MPHYSLAFPDPAGHLLDIVMTIEHPRPSQTLVMPSWIPGSYLMREFARHVVTLSASQLDGPVEHRKIDKSTWQFDCSGGGTLTVHYRVYAWDRSVRGCYFDQSRGFVNPAAALLQDPASCDAVHTLTIHAPAFADGHAWRCATSMPATKVDDRGFGDYRVDSYDELIDHPFECADFVEFRFEAGGVPHRFVISGHHRGDLERLRRDSQKICQAHCDLFAPASPDGKPPFANYLFQLHLVEDGYGGLEHRSSTALISPRTDLPVVGDPGVSEGYRDLLGLISHEYFHAWNVKRMKPAAFMPYDTTRENYTRLLWLFEGFTSYYDDLMVKRVGLITENDYLKVLGRRLTTLLRAPGVRLQAPADASFDAWIKYYRADENAPNSQFSYYVRGSFIALALDLMLRARPAHDGAAANSLDDVMRQLWHEFGQIGDAARGVPDDACEVFSRICGLDLREFFARYVDGTDEPDWSGLFLPFGISYRLRPAASAADRGGRSEATIEVNLRTLGVALGDASGGLPGVRHVLSGSAAWEAGIGAGDTLVAIDGLRANATTLGKYLARFALGDVVEFAYFRHDVLHRTAVRIPATPPDDTAWLVASTDDADALARRNAWLNLGLLTDQRTTNSPH